MKLFLAATFACASLAVATGCGVAGEVDTPRTKRPAKTKASRTVAPIATSATPTTAPPSTMAPTTSPATTAPTATSTTATAPPPAGNDSSTGSSWWKPTPNTPYQIQLSGTLDLSPAVKMFDLDLFDTDASTIAALQARGVKVVCYFSAGTYEDWRSDKQKFSADMYGAALPEWPGEFWVDTRHALVREIVRSRLQLAQQKGCDAVDPDNVDGAFNDSGFPLTAASQLDFNRFLAAEAHSLGLAVGLKNDLAQVKELAADFDFAVNEQCFQYSECTELVPFIELNKPVFGIEYEGAKRAACEQANALHFDTLFKSLDLKNERYSCREDLV